MNRNKGKNKLLSRPNVSGAALTDESRRNNKRRVDTRRLGVLYPYPYRMVGGDSPESKVHVGSISCNACALLQTVSWLFIQVRGSYMQM